MFGPHLSNGKYGLFLLILAMAMVEYKKNLLGAFVILLHCIIK